MEIWKASKDIHDRMKGLVAQNHPDLALVVDDIVIVFREKAGKSGGRVIMGRPKRASAMANALSGESFKFILDIGSDVWEGLLDHKKDALLDHLLCGCGAEEDPRTGEPKLSLRAPDISAFRENVERYGMWFPKEEADDEGPSPVEKMFGEEG